MDCTSIYSLPWVSFGKSLISYLGFDKIYKPPSKNHHPLLYEIFKNTLKAFPNIKIKGLAMKPEEIDDLLKFYKGNCIPKIELWVSKLFPNFEINQRFKLGERLIFDYTNYDDINDLNLQYIA